MAYSAWGKHTNPTGQPNDAGFDVSATAWNADHSQTGMIGYTASVAEVLLATDVLTLVDTLIYVGAESGVADTLARFANTNTHILDKVILFPTTGDTITVTHTETPAIAGQIHLADHTDRVLSETESLILYRVGDYWYEARNPRIFLDSEFKVVDEADPTKKFVISVGGNTAAKVVTLLFASPLDTTITFPSATSTLAALTGAESIKESFIVALSDETTILGVASTTVPLATFRMPYAFTVTAVRASLRTAGTGAALITCDIHESGTTILSTKITIDATETTSTTAVTAAVISDPALADDALIELFLDLRDTDNVATGLKVEIIGYKT